MAGKTYVVVSGVNLQFAGLIILHMYPVTGQTARNLTQLTAPFQAIPEWLLCQFWLLRLLALGLFKQAHTYLSHRLGRPGCVGGERDHIPGHL